VRTGVRCFIVLTVLLPLRALAGDLTVLIDDGHGHRVPDAVVTVERTFPTTAVVARQPVSRIIDQRDLAFVPYLEVFQPGDSVVFRNSDRTRHHVYSFSSVKSFEFVLAPGESSKPQRLEKSGVIAVGCNIHDQMIAYLYVSAAPWIGRSAADGHVIIHGLAPGRYNVHVWQPRIRPGRADQSQPVRVDQDSDIRSLHFSLSLLPDLRSRHGDPMGY
jgi:plastocyanin